MLTKKGSALAEKVLPKGGALAFYIVGIILIL
jgi:hypothetical protein